jgi:peptidoglycan/LPS O-acetylase OafA/YrhL
VQLAAVLFAVVISLFAAYFFWRLSEKPSAELFKSIGSKRDQKLAWQAGYAPHD